MSDVVTIYCCGTNFSRAQKNEEAVAHCWEQTHSRKLILDGPGSTTKANRDEHASLLKAEAIVKAVERSTTTKTRAVPEALFSAHREYDWKINPKGSLRGVGTADNVVMAIQWLWENFYVGKPEARDKHSNVESFSTVNLVGWSRGAVTCIMLAHAIQSAGFKELKPAMKVNIFAFDPVPGGLRLNDFSSKGATFESTGRAGSPESLPEIVDHYSSVLMEHENTIGFSCVSPKELNSSTAKREYPLPGVHSDCVMFKKDNPAGKLGMHLCQQFLKSNGTDGSFCHIKSDTEVVELYAEMRLKAVRKKAPSRQRSSNITNQQRDNIFFMNGHHYETFKKAYPELLAAIDERIVRNVAVPAIQTIAQKRNLPKTLKALESVGLIKMPQYGTTSAA